MSNLDWIQGVIFLLVIAVQSGVLYNKIQNLKDDYDDLSDDFTNYKKDNDKEIDILKHNHQTIQLTIVNSPTKDDIKGLSAEVQSLKMTLIRLEVILEHVAKSNNITIKDNGHHGDS
jgi:hypothetical protein